MIESVKTFLKHKKAVKQLQYFDVIQEFIAVNGKNTEERRQLIELLKGRETLFEICRLVQIVKHFNPEEKGYDDFFADMKKFFKAMDLYFNHKTNADKKTSDE